jgi:pimeloyl-ACP methyl ester carboxylesterase
MRQYSGRDPSRSSFREVIAICWRLGRWLLLAYVIVAVGAHFYAASALFQPAYGSRAEPAGLLRIPQPQGEPLAGVYLPNPKAKYTIWFFHGNAEALGDTMPFLEAMRAHGYAVFAFDYPGYGLSAGEPTEESVNAATLAAAFYLRHTLRVPLTQVVLYGHSLGGGPAVELAAQVPVAGLVLQSAFTSVYRVMTHWRLLPFDKFENLAKIGHVSCPVFVMHGTFDRVVPFHHGQALFQAVPGRKAALWIDTAGHNNFLQVAGARYWAGLKHFTESLHEENSPN